MVLLTQDIRIFLLTLIGCIAIIVGLIYLRRYRLIKNTSLSKIEQISSGFHKISGIVDKDKSIQSKFTNKSCVYFKFLIEEHQLLSLKNEWKEKMTYSHHIDFSLQDKTGKILVNPNNAIFNIAPDFELKIKRNSRIPSNIQDFLKENNIQFKGGLTGKYKTIKIREWVIQPNDKLYIMGEISEKDHEVTCNRCNDELSSKIISKEKPSFMLYISDQSEEIDLKALKFKIISWLGGGLVINGFFIWVYLANFLKN